MKKSEYDVEVVFSTSVFVKVNAFDKQSAMEEAEDEAYHKFNKMLQSGELGSGDFYYEAQTP